MINNNLVDDLDYSGYHMTIYMNIHVKKIVTGEFRITS